MANIFLDTNIVFDILVRNKKKALMLSKHKIFISPLSYHIYYYSENLKVPDRVTITALKKLEVINLNKKLLDRSLHSPTKDLEDNIQLQSGLVAKADYFLTSDKKLLKMKSFGKMKIVNSL